MISNVVLFYSFDIYCREVHLRSAHALFDHILVCFIVVRFALAKDQRRLFVRAIQKCLVSVDAVMDTKDIQADDIGRVAQTFLNHPNVQPQIHSFKF